VLPGSKCYITILPPSPETEHDSGTPFEQFVFCSGLLALCPDDKGLVFTIALTWIKPQRLGVFYLFPIHALSWKSLSLVSLISFLLLSNFSSPTLLQSQPPPCSCPLFLPSRMETSPNHLKNAAPEFNVSYPSMNGGIAGYT
jgi:hypothetical protein